MNNQTGNKLAAVFSSVATGLALSAILLGTAQGNDEFYIDRPMPSYGPGAEVNEVPTIEYDECTAVADANGVFTCRIGYSNGDEDFYYKRWKGDCLEIHHHYYPPAGETGMPHGGCANRTAPALPDDII